MPKINIKKRKHSDLELTIELYDKGKISLGKAAAIAGIPYDEMLDALYLHGIQPRFEPTTKEESEKELQLANRLLQRKGRGK